MDAHLGVVLVGTRELAVVGGGHEVVVAVDQDLPAHVHGLGIDAAEQTLVLAGIVHVAPIVGCRNRELRASEHPGGVIDLGVDRVALVGEGAVEALDIGNFGDLVAFHGVHADASETAMELVVDPQVLAVVDAVGVAPVDVVGVAGGVFRRSVGLGAEDRLGFVGVPPADQGVHVEDRDALQFASGRKAVDAYLARMAATGKCVIFIELARRHLVLAVVDGLAFGLARRGGRRRRSLLLAAGRQT